jgi:hypothetical protein
LLILAAYHYYHETNLSDGVSTRGKIMYMRIILISNYLIDERMQNHRVMLSAIRSIS